MMEQLHNMMRAQAAMAGAGKLSVLVAIVSSFSPDRYAAKVLIQPEGIETGWLPIASQWTGNNWGLFVPPSPKDVVLVYCIDGSLETGVIGPSMFNNTHMPLSVQSGELWVVHQSGSTLRLLADGSVTLASKSGKAVNITGDVNISGKLTATGDVKSSGGNVSDQVGTIASMRSTFNTHTHTDPQGGVTGPPSATM